MITAQNLDAALHRKPFAPFRIVTKTGKTYDITERDVRNIGVFKTFVFIGIRARETDKFFDHHEDVAYDNIASCCPNFDRYEAVSLLHAVRLEPIPLSAATG